MITDNKLWIASVLIMSGCLSQIAPLSEYKKSWIGHPISELKEAMSHPNVMDSYKSKIGWKDRTYELPNGNSVFAELEWKDCVIHWEVNPEGIIVGSRTEGNGCKWH